MNALKNRVQLIGNVGNKPEVKTTVNGKKLVRILVATNEIYRNSSGEKITETQWHNAVAWGKQAEIAEKFLEKGHEIALEGKLVTRHYVDRQGVKRSYTEVQVSELLLLGNR